MIIACFVENKFIHIHLAERKRERKGSLIACGAATDTGLASVLN